MAGPEYLTINELPVGATGLYEFQFAGGYLEQAHVKLDFVTSLGVRTNYTLTAPMFITEFTLQIPALDIPVNAVSVRIYRETPRAEPLLNFTNGARLNEANLDRLAKQTIFVAAEAFDAGAFAVAEDLIGQALEAIATTQALIEQAQDIVDTASASASASAASQSAAAASAALALTRANASDASAVASAASALAAASSATAANNSRALAVTAQGLAEQARDIAITNSGAAATSATNSANSATASSNSAAAALASQNAASGSAGVASSAATSASNSASAAATTLTNVQATITNIAGKNRIINGDARVAQRPGIGLQNSVFQYGQVDRMIHFVTATTVSGTITQGTGFAGLSSFAAAVAFTSTGSTSGGIGQRIESRNCRDLGGSNIAVRVRVQHNFGVSLPVVIELRRANALDNFATATAISASAVTQCPSDTSTVVSSVLTVPAGLADNGLEVLVTFSGLANVSPSKFFGITDFQVEKGAVHTPFEVRPFGVELALCQRYFYAYESGADGQGDLGIGFCRSTTSFLYQVKYAVPMRVTPTFSFTGIAAEYAVALASGAIAANGLAVQARGPQSTMCEMTTAGGLTAGQPGRAYAAGGTRKLEFSAEL